MTAKVLMDPKRAPISYANDRRKFQTATAKRAQKRKLAKKARKANRK